MLKHYLSYYLVVVATLLLFSNIALAQSVVHTESSDLSRKSDGFTGKLNLNLNFVQNINDVLQSNGNAQMQYRIKKHSFISLSALNLTVLNGNRILNDGLQHLRYGYDLTNRVTMEAFSQAQYNEIIKIQGRYLNGAGPRFSIFSSDSINLLFGTLYMYEHENETTGITNTHHRLSAYLSSGWQATDAINLDFIIYFQPDLMRPKDYRVSTEFTMETTITKRLSYRLALAWFYDAFPPDGIRNVFYNIRNGLSFSF